MTNNYDVFSGLYRILLIVLGIISLAFLIALITLLLRNATKNKKYKAVQMRATNRERENETREDGETWTRGSSSVSVEYANTEAIIEDIYNNSEVYMGANEVSGSGEGRDSALHSGSVKITNGDHVYCGEETKDTGTDVSEEYYMAMDTTQENGGHSGGGRHSDDLLKEIDSQIADEYYVEMSKGNYSNNESVLETKDEQTNSEADSENYMTMKKDYEFYGGEEQKSEATEADSETVDEIYVNTTGRQSIY